MCDTLVATPEATKNGVMILAKNSDRQPGEKQVVEFVPARNPRERIVRCTYTAIPQAKRIYATFLSRPTWMFGAEIGVNEHGVAIGNEAVYSKRKYRKTGLTGMDMLRLALERSPTAKEALRVIISLLKKYGQGGNCGYNKAVYYHNSFIVADPKEAYVLETADNAWAWKKVKSVYTISNQYTLEKPDASNVTDFYSLKARSPEYKPDARRAKTLEFLQQQEGRITKKDMMWILRSHGDVRICRHDSLDTAGSMVAVLRPGRESEAYFTGKAYPCKNAFRRYAFR